MTAESLITDDAWVHLTSEDAAVLILSVVLHDCAMHLSEDGFIELINPDKDRTSISVFSDKSWPEIWANFLTEASRFDQKKLKSLFGDTEPMRRPPDNPSQLTLRDRLLIGEFLRRHHSRLAHEIALSGVPGPTKDRIELIRVSEGLANLSGLIARSHGLDLRNVVEKIPRIHRREQYKVHTPFLMTVVRIADYLQIHSQRAPKQVLNVRALRSPTSQGEWKAHEAIQEINSTHDDPEALVVIAIPKDVRTFLKLEKLLAGLQHELDESWAVLGEVYGRVQGLRELGITIRRIKSNLDDREEFSKTVPYYPDRIAFNSDPDILKLLIEPLYGDDGGIAVRELVQNAVDACLERGDYLKHSVDSSKGHPHKDQLVTVHLDESGEVPWLTVTDTGIGMTASVIKNYFLKAGASFRRSDAWKEQHESDGRPRVLRSGRFGIGVLAAFLLGDSVQVNTKHVSELRDRGIHFSASIDDEAIELQKIEIAEIGTTIRIRLSKETAEHFRRTQEMTWDRRWDWDWYRLPQPRVELKITEKNEQNAVRTFELKPKYFIPKCGAKLPVGWHHVSHPDFDDVQWSFAAGTYRNPYQRETFFVNGIRVGSYTSFKKNLAWLFSIESPVISVFDSAGKLPLNLSRSKLTRELPFERELLEDIYRDLISFLIVNAPSAPVRDYETGNAYEQIRYPGKGNECWFWCTPKGISIARKWFLKQISPPHLYLIPSFWNWTFKIPSKEAYVATFGRGEYTAKYYEEWLRFALTGTGRAYLGNNWLEGISATGRRVLVTTWHLNRIRSLKVIPKTFLRNIVVEWTNSNWAVLSTKDCPPAKISFENFAHQQVGVARDGDENPMLAEWYFEPGTPGGKDNTVEAVDEYEYSYEDYGATAKKPSLFLPVWMKTIGLSSIIPYSARDRKRILADAYTKLNSYIKAHEATRDKQPAKSRSQKSEEFVE